MYRSDGDGMRPRPLLGMANLEKRPSLKRGESEERVVVAKKSSKSPEPLDEECEPDYDSNSDSYEPDYYDDTIDDLSRKDNSTGFSSGGPVQTVRRGEKEPGKVENMSSSRHFHQRQRENIPPTTNTFHQSEDRRGSHLDRGGQHQGRGEGMEAQMTKMVVRALEDTKGGGQERSSGNTRMESRGSKGEVNSSSKTRNTVSMRAAPATKTSEEIFKEAIDHRVPHKNIPIPLTEKRRLMRMVGSQYSVTSFANDETPALIR